VRPQQPVLLLTVFHNVSAAREQCKRKVALLILNLIAGRLHTITQFAAAMCLQAIRSPFGRTMSISIQLWSKKLPILDCKQYGELKEDDAVFGFSDQRTIQIIRPIFVAKI
jgi:hypothetical protein